MKRITFSLVIFMGFAVVSGFCGGNKEDIVKLQAENDVLRARNETLDAEKATAESDKRFLEYQIADKDKQIEELSRLEMSFIPLTWEIISQVNEAGNNKLKELNYYLSTPITLITNSKESNLGTQNGRLVINVTNVSEKIELTSDNRGELSAFNSSPRDKESLEVRFPDYDIILKFERKTEKNWFEPVSVLSSAKTYSILTDGVLPHLRIYLDYIQNDEWDTPMVQNISTGIPQPLPLPLPPPPPPPTPNPPPSVNPVPPSPVKPLSPDRNIIGNGVLEKDDIVAYIQSRNRNMPHRNIEAIVSVYLAEAQKERVNHDIAIAQICEGTNFLSRQESLNTHNYGDLQKIGNRQTRFSDMQAGVRAHIQQLKAYASSGSFSSPTVDRIRVDRIKSVRGKVKTLDDLFPYWVTKNQNSYRNTINTLLNDMYLYSLSPR